MRLLWIAQKWPIPADDGAKQATSQLLVHLSRRGVSVNLLAIVGSAEELRPPEAERVFGVETADIVRVEKGNRLKQLAAMLRTPSVPVTLSAYVSPEVASRVERYVAQHPDAVVVHDGLHAAGWRLASTRPAGLREIYRAHNREADLWYQAARFSRNPFRRTFLRLQGGLIRAFEDRVCRASQLVLPVSESDKAWFDKVTDPSRVIPLPIGMTVSPAEHVSFENKLLFVGRLDWAPNRDGLRWFLRSVWPSVRALRPDLGLDLVGSGDGSWLTSNPLPDGVQFHGRVPDVAPYYRSCLAALVPVFYGSGTRVKAIEASLYGKPCISSALGVEGIGLEEGRSYLRAEGAEDWLRILTSLTPAEAEPVGRAAKETIAERYDPKRIADAFIQAADRLQMEDLRF
jgi:glycosyltransferase involved in cell wall biosynthesis